MNSIFSKILAAFLLLMPMSAVADVQAPLPLEVTGVVVSHTPKIKSAAIVNDSIWWEGDTIKLRKEDNSWVTLTLTKVEMVEGRGGVLTFTIKTDAKVDPTFKVGIKKAKKNAYGNPRYGLHRK